MESKSWKDLEQLAEWSGVGNPTAYAVLSEGHRVPFVVYFKILEYGVGLVS